MCLHRLYEDMQRPPWQNTKRRSITLATYQMPLEQEKVKKRIKCNIWCDKMKLNEQKVNKVSTTVAIKETRESMLIFYTACTLKEKWSMAWLHYSLCGVSIYIRTRCKNRYEWIAKQHSEAANFIDGFPKQTQFPILKVWKFVVKKVKMKC